MLHSHTNTRIKIIIIIIIVPYIHIRRLEWAGHKDRRGKDSKKGSKRQLPYHKTSGKTKN